MVKDFYCKQTGPNKSKRSCIHWSRNVDQIELQQDVEKMGFVLIAWKSLSSLTRGGYFIPISFLMSTQIIVLLECC